MKALPLAVAAALTFAVASTASADVKVTMQNGRVTIVAKDATVRQILTEWARVGQTKIVNVERIPGGPQTIELTNVPEAEALEILLRSISGFMVAPRAAAAPVNASLYDRIVVMPTVAAPRSPAPTTAGPAQPVFPTQPVPQVTDDDVDDERPAQPVPPGAQRGPIFNQFPQPQVVNPQTGQPMAQPQPFVPPQPNGAQPPPAPAQPSTVPTAPFGGVSVPGMVAPAPQQPGQQPGQVVQPGVVQPGQPPRRPGGIEGEGL
jgi:hypothetical protein